MGLGIQRLRRREQGALPAAPRPYEAGRPVHTAVMLDQPERDALRALATRLGRPMTTVGRAAVLRFLEETVGYTPAAGTYANELIEAANALAARGAPDEDTNYEDRDHA